MTSSYFPSADTAAKSLLISRGNPLSFHAWKPPAKGRTLLIPSFFSSSAARALVASFGQVQ
jgi:hypothetical protein